jgi:hypothetical protein
LEQAGIDDELITFEDESHGIHWPQNHRVLYPSLAWFFEGACAATG